MVIIRTSATEVRSQAVSPELPVHFSTTDAEQLGGAAGAAGAAWAAGAAAGAAGAACAAAGAGLSSANAAGDARPIRSEDVSAARRLVNLRTSVMGWTPEIAGKGPLEARLRKANARFSQRNP